MAYANSRSNNAELIEGTTDRKYMKARSDSALDSMNAKGNEITARNRRGLNTWDGYTPSEAVDKVSPGKL